MQRITITTNENREVIDITDDVQRAIGNQAGHTNGIVTVHVAHTTAAVSTADLDPGGTDQDFLDAFDAIVPGSDEIGYRHPHNPDHMPDHILSTLIGTDVTIPVEQGRMALGQWQHVVLFEFDGPRDRTLVISVISEE